MFSLCLLSLFGLLAVNTANAAPACETGSHYEGSYVESQVCSRVCTRTIWGMCVRYENRCQTVGEWVGSCVADPVVEPIVEEPVIEEPVVEEPIVEPVIEEPVVEPVIEPVVEEPIVESAPTPTPTPVQTNSHPAVVQGLNNRIDNFTGLEYRGFNIFGKVGFLTNLKGLGCVQAGAMTYCEQTPSVYHIVDLNGYRGLITPFVMNNGNQIKGLTKNIE